MKIKTKMLLVVLPLLVASVVMVGFASYFLSTSAINRVAVDSLTFRSKQLVNYADNQWNILVENGAVGDPFFERAVQDAVESFARSLLNSDTESIFALDKSGETVIRTGPMELSAEERDILQGYFVLESAEFIMIKTGGESRAAYTCPLRLFGWQIFITEARDVFYGRAETIFNASFIILAGVTLAGTLCVFLMASFLTKPMEILVNAMDRITETHNLQEEAPILYNDEIGKLSFSFNGMVRTLANAQEQIKKHAFEAVVARKRESKIRNVFQLYVPKDVIDQVFANPENMLTGNNREVAILFSDIRSFTTISEGMEPDDLVNSLNRYFAAMVDIIMDHNGVVDKYIGDAIMAIFGAPASYGNDALSSVMAGLEMIRELEGFNQKQRELGAPEFRIGVGINYGTVTVGNIGCEKKMNYTVIGDSVNLASRLEGLTKQYQEPVLFSDTVAKQLAGAIPSRVIDKVAVKGKTQGAFILTSRLSLTEAETAAWKYHQEAVKYYYHQRFQEGLACFEKVLEYLPDDLAAARFISRCRMYLENPPDPDWNGVEIIHEK